MQLQHMRAMILAAGIGKRMRPLTFDRPKSLLQVAGRSLLDHHLDRLAAGGIPEVVVNTHYLGDKIAQHVASRTATRPRIMLSREDRILETGGGVKRALPLLGDQPFFVLNSDMLWLDGAMSALDRLAKTWNEQHMDVLMLMVPLAEAVGHQGGGDFVIKPNGRLARPHRPVSNSLVFAGLLITTPALYQDIPDGAFSQRLIWERAERSQRLFGLIHHGRWFHVGDPQALHLANTCWRELETAAKLATPG